MDSSTLLAIYRAMVTARQIDLLEQELINRGEAFFHVAGTGHEATAALAPHLHEGDYLCPHYRDKALAIARGMTAEHFFEGLHNKANSHTDGRQMCAHFSHRRLNIVTMAGPVGNATMHAVGVAHTVKDQENSPIVLSSTGEGTTQEGEYLEALSEAARDHLPVMFLIQDNRLRDLDDHDRPHVLRSCETADGSGSPDSLPRHADPARRRPRSGQRL